MIDIAEERKAGQGYPPGETRSAIIRFLTDYPDGIEEMKLRDWLRENKGIKQKKPVIGHLMALKENGALSLQHPSGKDNIWKLAPDKKTQVKICVATLLGDLKAVLHEHSDTQKKQNEDRIRRFNTEYVQRAIDTTLLPLFKKHYKIDTSMEKKLPKELMTFIESGFKMSPTAVLAILTHSHLASIAVGLFREALHRNTTQELDNVSVAIVTLYIYLLTDLKKYSLCPGVEDKISAFLSEPPIISAISTWVGWDFTDFYRAHLYF